jgi:Sulfotransferase domain
MKNKIFIISMPKSMTTSTTLFLKNYNYNTMHWIGGYVNLNNLEKKSTEFFINFAKDYDVCSDTPYHLLFKELDSHYKNSKFIYINRNKEDWARSCLKHIKITGLDYFESINYENIKLFKDLTDKNNFLHLIEKYKIHNNAVLEYFKNKNNFLYLEANDINKEEKICNFLNIEFNKNITFPRENVTGSSNGPKKIN